MGPSCPPNPLGAQYYCVAISAGCDSFSQSDVSFSGVASRLRFDYCYTKPKILFCSENNCSKNILFSAEKSFRDEYWMFPTTWVFIILVSHFAVYFTNLLRVLPLLAFLRFWAGHPIQRQVDPRARILLAALFKMNNKDPWLLPIPKHGTQNSVSLQLLPFHFSLQRSKFMVPWSQCHLKGKANILCLKAVLLAFLLLFICFTSLIVPHILIRSSEQPTYCFLLLFPAATTIILGWVGLQPIHSFFFLANLPEVVGIRVISFVR